MTALKPRKTTAVTTKKVMPTKKTVAVKEVLTKSQILAHLADASALTKKQISVVLDSLGVLIEASIKTRGPGAFTFPGLFKIVAIKKPARKARPGINSFTGEAITIQAKPAHHVVRIRPLKKLKEMVV